MNTEFTAQVRKAVKRECKARVVENWSRCIGIRVLYTVPFVLLAVIQYLALFGRAFSMIVQGYTDEYRIGLAIMQGMNTVWVVLFLALLIGGPLQYGIMQFYIRLRRGERPPVSTLLAPFFSLHSLWTGIKMGCCLAFRAMLWMIGPTVIYTLAVMSAALRAAVSGRLLSEETLILSGLIYGIVLVLIEIKLLTYHAGWVVLHDQGEGSVWDASGNASRVFRGQYGKLLVFQLSFFGWHILRAGIWGLSLGLAAAGLDILPFGTGMAVFVLALVAALCLDIVLGSFVTAYVNTSFVGMYEYLAAPVGAPRFPPEDSEL